ncbi:MAG: hypothetical protein Q8R76_07200 [Candidatus Omnitrophota bacterium]|nr:hypothetical protein [Candidatus Omnitrophota bacterium]
MRNLPAQIGFALLILLTSPKLLWACSVCFGDPSSRAAKSVSIAVLVMLGVIVSMLAGVGATILVWMRRAKKVSEISSSLQD